MSTLTDLPVEAEKGPVQAKGRSRILIIALVVLAAGLLAVGAWAIMGQSDETSNAEVEQVIDDYLTALGANAAGDARDIAALEALVTDDYVASERMHRVFGDQLAVLTDEFTLDDFVFSVDWVAEQVGEPVVTGEGPWFASVVENWSIGADRSPGTATYVIVDDGGKLKVAGWHWVGTTSQIQ